MSLHGRILACCTSRNPPPPPPPPDWDGRELEEEDEDEEGLLPENVASFIDEEDIRRQLEEMGVDPNVRAHAVVV